MAIFMSNTLGVNDPNRAMNIKALETRAQALAAAQAKQEVPTSMPSPWQGASHVFNTAADAFATKRADQAAAQQRQELAAIQGQIGPEGPNPQQRAGITARDPELGKMYESQAFQSRQNAADIAARKEAAAEAARQNEAAAVAQESRVAGRPKTDIAQINEDAKAGRMTEEERVAAIKRLTAQPPAEQKFVAEEQDRNIDLQSSLSGLKEAHDLLDQGIYSGAGAGAKEYIGKNLPGVVGSAVNLVASQPIDEATTKRTDRYNKIMAPEVLAMLSKMKGAQSDKELMFALGTMNDPSSSDDAKKQALKTLYARVSAHLARSEQTLKDLGGKKVEVEKVSPMGAPPAGAGAAPAAAPAAGAGVQSVASEAEALALPPGTRFKLPDGRTGTAR